MKHLLFVFTILLAFGSFSTLPATADNLYAAIRGTVVDPTGAVVAGAKLTATNTATGVSYSATTSQNGSFSFQQVPIGDYSVRAEQSGFKAYQASGIHVDLNQIYNLDIKLALGEISQELVVEANPVQVNQTDIQLGTTVTGQQIVDIPLNGVTGPNCSNSSPGWWERRTVSEGLMEVIPAMVRRPSRTRSSSMETTPTTWL